MRPATPISAFEAFDADTGHREEDLKRQQKAERTRFASEILRPFVLAVEGDGDDDAKIKAFEDGIRRGSRLAQRHLLERAALRENRAIARRSVETHAFIGQSGTSGLLSAAPAPQVRVSGSAPLRPSLLSSSPAVSVHSHEESVDCDDQCTPVVDARAYSHDIRPCKFRHRRRHYMPGQLVEQEAQTDTVPEDVANAQFLLVEVDTSDKLKGDEEERLTQHVLDLHNDVARITDNVRLACEDRRKLLRQYEQFLDGGADTDPASDRLYKIQAMKSVLENMPFGPLYGQVEAVRPLVDRGNELVDTMSLDVAHFSVPPFPQIAELERRFGEMVSALERLCGDLEPIVHRIHFRQWQGQVDDPRRRVRRETGVISRDMVDSILEKIRVIPPEGGLVLPTDLSVRRLNFDFCPPPRDELGVLIKEAMPLAAELRRAGAGAVDGSCAVISLECSETLPPKIKLSCVFFAIAMASAFADMGIPYSVLVFADYNFQFIVKPFDEPHGRAVLQRILDATMADRFAPRISDACYYAKYNLACDQHPNRSFFVISDGLDPNLHYAEDWNKHILCDPNDSFGFYFVRSELLPDEDTVTELWRRFSEQTEVAPALCRCVACDRNDMLNLAPPIIDQFESTLSRRDPKPRDAAVARPQVEDTFEKILECWDDVCGHLDMFKELCDEPLCPESTNGFQFEDAGLDGVNRVNPAFVPEKAMYPRDAFAGQKILVCCFWSKVIAGAGESDWVDPKFLTEHFPGSEWCVQDVLDHYGIRLTVVQNYKEGMLQIQTGQYYAAWVICGANTGQLPDGGNPHLVYQFVQCLEIFWKKGGAVVWWCDNHPLTFECNEWLKIADFPRTGDFLGGRIDLRLVDGCEGTKTLHRGDTSVPGARQVFDGKQEVDFTFYRRHTLAHNLASLYEGYTISKANDSACLGPFTPFSYDSSGGISSMFFLAGFEMECGDVIIDCGFTKLFTELTEDGTLRYVQNMAALTIQAEKYLRRLGNNGPKTFRPKAFCFPIEEPVPFDVLYLCGATGSMGRAIRSAKNHCVAIARELASTYPHFHFQFGAVFYRDPVDSPYDKHERFSLTDNILLLQSQIASVQPLGGGDYPEDWVGAYTIALHEINWRHGHKLIIHLANAPAHGSLYGGEGEHEEEAAKLKPLIVACADQRIKIVGMPIRRNIDDGDEAEPDDGGERGHDDMSGDGSDVVDRGRDDDELGVLCTGNKSFAQCRADYIAAKGLMYTIRPLGSSGASPAVLFKTEIIHAVVCAAP